MKIDVLEELILTLSKAPKGRHINYYKKVFQGACYQVMKKINREAKLRKTVKPVSQIEPKKLREKTLDQMYSQDFENE